MQQTSSLDDSAVALLHSLCGPQGIHASLASVANYRAIFSRDGVMAGIAGLLLKDSTICEAFARTLDHLRELQGPEGQIASNFEMHPAGNSHVSFGTLAPRIDAATWYLVGVALAARANIIDAAKFRQSISHVVHCLDALEYNGRDLIYIPTGGNWADEYIYDGYILYDQVLRGWGLRLVGELYGEPRWVEKSASIGRTIATRYAPREEAHAPYPIAAFSPIREHTVFDLAATTLLAVSKLTPTLAAQSLDWVEREFLARDALPPAFHPVIHEGDPDWPALRRYHLHAFRNAPHEYHNGGIWPIWLGWLALAFATTGRDAARIRLREIAETTLRAAPDFAFEEYLHGSTREPAGTMHMAYTATGLIFLRLAGTNDALQLLAP